MRFALLVLAWLAWWAAVGTGAARAHTCASPVVVDVGEGAPVPIGVAAEQMAVTGVAIEVPTGFRLARVRPPTGWQATADDREVALRSGTIEPFGCATAVLEGTATDQGELAFRVTATAADGTTAVSIQSAFAVARGRAFPLGTLLGVGLVALGVAGAAVAFLRRRRVSSDGGR